MTDLAPPQRASSTESDTSSADGAATFRRRHNGPGPDEISVMLETLGLSSLDRLVDQAVPRGIRMQGNLALGAGTSEHRALEELRQRAAENLLLRSLIGAGYYDTVTPPPVQRNILENPGWYTAYTPYQAEIAQGRLEMLLNFQTMILDLTGMEIANASLLDEATAAAEAMTLSLAAYRGEGRTFFVAEDCHPQTIEVVRTRAWPLGIQVAVGRPEEATASDGLFGALLQYPSTEGGIRDPREIIERLHDGGALVTMACDLLSLALLAPPGELGADIAVGSTQRFGVPMGYGGPHAAYFATRDRFKRLVPGRIVGVSQDSTGRPALRLALQTREQHIRRDRATSNICTAQVLPAVLAAAYALYHGPEGLRGIARRIHRLTATLARGLEALGYALGEDPFFDTLHVSLDGTADETALLERARQAGFNLRGMGRGAVGLSLDETSTDDEVRALVDLFARHRGRPAPELEPAAGDALPEALRRTSPFLTHPVFHLYRSETELLRYLKRLENRDLSLTTSMIPLGSCTMKLNAAVEMLPITWPGFARLHPFVPRDQALGYARLFRELETWLQEITGFAGVSLQPNAGSQGEYTGLLVIRRHHESRGEGHRNVCLIPESAHGTNPASAVMAGLRVVVVACDEEGNIDLGDLRAKAEAHAADLAALMVTYPSTHGVFEEAIRDICAVVHEHGGQVYLDGANLNAQVGLCRPGDYGADVCHLNLHKTFCIPHGGGGPGMGPIAVQPHLVPFLPGHGVVGLGGEESLGAVAAAPWGSPSILPISWAYIRLMGGAGLTEASKIAILNANYVARRLEAHFPVLYRGPGGLVAHECILDLRPLKRSAGVEVDDVAKRLMDYGFHAPTVSWPVAGTVMVEPTESESKAELDRFCDALIAIRREAADIESGAVPLEASVLRQAPHTAHDLLAEPWSRPYSREQAAFPAPWTREHKYWPPVARIDNAFGDRHLVCACLPMEAYEES